MASCTQIGIFSDIESEEKQLVELRQFFAEKEVSIDKKGPADVFANLREVLDVSKFIARLQNEKEVEMLLNSLFSLLISFKDNQLLQLVDSFCKLLTSEDFRGHGWNSTAGIAVRLLSNLFNLHSDLPSLQLLELKHLLHMAGRAKLTQFLNIGVDKIGELSLRWKLDMEQRRELYRLLHHALITDERHETAAEVMCTLLKTYTEKDADKARDDAKECVRTAVVDPKSFCFDHLLHLNAVKSLEQSDPQMFKVLSIFVHGSLTEYRQFIATNPNFVQEYLKADEELLNKKIKMLTLISLAEKRQIIPLNQLCKELDIPDEGELEEFIIEAIRAKAINGKIDEMNGCLVVSFHQQRVFGRPQWQQLHSRLGVLLDNMKWFTGNLHSLVANGDEGFSEK